MGLQDTASQGVSPGVRRGVHRCALRGILNSLPNKQFQEELQKADVAAHLQVS